MQISVNSIIFFNNFVLTSHQLKWITLPGFESFHFVLIVFVLFLYDRVMNSILSRANFLTNPTWLISFILGTVWTFRAVSGRDCVLLFFFYS